MQEKQDSNGGDVLPEQKKKLCELNGGGYFTVFEWQPDGYGQLIEQKRKELMDSKEATEKLHKGHPFKSGVIPRRLKHENLLGEQD